MKKLLILKIFITFIFLNTLVYAQPCQSGYDYRSPIYVDNSSNPGQSDYQLKITFNSSALISAGKMQSDGDDIRILDSKGNNLDYYLVPNTINTSSTEVWLEIKNLSGYGKDTLYLFYGSSAATGVSSAASTFDVYEEFAGTSLGSSWSTCGSGTATVSGSSLSLSSTSGNSIGVFFNTNYNNPLTLEAKVNSASGSRAVIGLVNGSGSGYGMSLESSNMVLTELSKPSCFTFSNISSSTAGSTSGVWKLDWDGSNNQSLSWPGGNSSGTSTAVTSASASPVLYVGNGTSSISLDYIILRKKDISGLSYNLGKEVSMVYSINPSYTSPLCAGGSLSLKVDTIAGAVFTWTGPNGFNSNLQNPMIPGVSSVDAGLYTVTVTIPSSCASQTSSVNVNISAAANGGTVSGSQTVCGGSNTGQLSLNGQVGNVVRWDSANNSNGPWYSIANTNLTQTYKDLNTTTFYRAIVENGGCSSDTSTIGIITITPRTLGGIVTGGDSACENSNSGILTLNSYRGNIVRWESSLNGNLWSTISNRTTQQSYLNLRQTTFYRAIVQNGICDETASSVDTVYIDKLSKGGDVNSNASVCEGSNTGLLKLSNQLGRVVRWESSSTGNFPWISITNETDSLRYNNVSSTTYYRAALKNGLCGIAFSNPAIVSTFQSSDAGNISGGTEVCEGSNSGTLISQNTIGTIQKWQYKTLGSANWNDVNSTSSTYSWGSLNDTTEYRVIVKNQSCPNDTSDVETINVSQETQEGFISGDKDVCEGNNSGIISLSSYIGDIVKWEESSTGFSPWTDLNNTNDTNNFSNLTQTTYFRATIKNGVCATKTTSPFRVNVSTLSDAGEITPNSEACSDFNFGILSIKNYNGEVDRWQVSNDNSNWTDIPNTLDRQDYRNLTQTTYYRALVKSGVCDEDTSKVSEIKIYKPTFGGNIIGDSAFCSKDNNNTLVLQNYLGSVQYWQTSVSGGIWEDTLLTSDTFKIKNLDKTTFYRAYVKNGACAGSFSEATIQEIVPASNAGHLISDNTNLCGTSNFGLISANEYLGNVTKWQKTSDTLGQWTDIINTTNTLYFFNLEETTYFRVLVSNEKCSNDTSEYIKIEITDLSNAGTIEGLENSYCQGNNQIELYLNGKNGEKVNWQSRNQIGQAWQNLSTSDTLKLQNIAENTFIRASIQNGICNEVFSEAVIVSIDQKTEAGNIIGDTSICNENESLFSLQNNTGDDIRWQYSDNISGPFSTIQFGEDELLFAENPGKYFIRAVVKNGSCSEENTQLFPATITTGPSAIIQINGFCDGQATLFSNTTLGSNLKHNWEINDGFKTNDSAFNKFFLSAGKYLVQYKVIDGDGCLAQKDTAIEILSSPIARFNRIENTNNPVACVGDEIDFQNTTYYEGNDTLIYQWFVDNQLLGNNTDFTLTIKNAGSKEIKLLTVNNNGCNDSATRFLTAYLGRNVVIEPNEITMTKGIGQTISAKNSIYYKWFPESIVTSTDRETTVATITDNQLLYVEGIDNNGCISLDSVFLTLNNEIHVIPNNVITPEGNDQNDVWVIDNLFNYESNTVTVYDRWGREVYAAENYQNDWGATNENGDLLTDGTYYYVVTVKDNQSKEKTFKGAITVIRNQ